jgi:hypothetical protein
MANNHAHLRIVMYQVQLPLFGRSVHHGRQNAPSVARQRAHQDLVIECRRLRPPPRRSAPWHARHREDLVETLDDAVPDELATVDERRAFHDAWLAERGKR